MKFLKGDIMSETNAVDYKFNGTQLIVTVDPNKDGQPVVTLTIEMAEIPDEVLAAIASKKGN